MLMLISLLCFYKDHIGGLHVLHQNVSIDLPPYMGLLLLTLVIIYSLSQMINSRALYTEYWPITLVQESLLHAFFAQVFTQIQGFMHPSRNYCLKTILQNTENFRFQNFSSLQKVRDWYFSSVAIQDLTTTFISYISR
ncbi:hypothetical protein CR513_56500 [Mucuna pruriens]|uniref:Uncharacterized protein n=1 Tax=Mucuna pruriens TaxID=157652 RepID=A0A371EFR4_MUCPR|nr:hypothetical protein CR513_56500 [Mucuna pruriens]